MTDIELLELAAKAARLTGEYKFNGYGTGNFVVRSDKCKTGFSWNPLTNDGNALRLAVSLQLEIDICLTGIAVRTPTGHKVLVDASEEPDPYEATRRAIVRAAAEIGKAMK